MTYSQKLFRTPQVCHCFRENPQSNAENLQHANNQIASIISACFNYRARCLRLLDRDKTKHSPAFKNRDGHSYFVLSCSCEPVHILAESVKVLLYDQNLKDGVPTYQTYDIYIQTINTSAEVDSPVTLTESCSPDAPSRLESLHRQPFVTVP